MEDWRSLVGQTWDSTYVLEELVGEGGFGVVFRARHRLLGELRAIKVLKYLVPGDDEAARARAVLDRHPPAPAWERIPAEPVVRVWEMYARFVREGQVLAQLHQRAGGRHPNLALVYDVRKTPEGRPWLVMDWLEGKTLWRFLGFSELTLAGRRWPWEVAFAVLEPVASVVGFAHEHGIALRRWPRSGPPTVSTITRVCVVPMDAGYRDAPRR